MNDQGSQSETPIGYSPPTSISSTSTVQLPSSTAQEEIDILLPETKGQIGDVAACLAKGITDQNSIVTEGAAANAGAVSNLLSNIAAIRDGTIPKSPSRATLARSAARSFLKQHKSRLSDSAVDHLEQVITKTDEVASDNAAAEKETEELAKKGAELEDLLEEDGGVYVYTYPHYWRHPTAVGTSRTLLKVGYTTKDAGQRGRDQARGTNVPEKPLLLRVYRSAQYTPQVLEQKFHRLLKAADHQPSDNAGNKEWFETSTEYLDTVAQELGVLGHEAGDSRLMGG
ncbi:MAG: hypothetical protein ACI8RE_000284 [Ilumatobacter sp.]|jgi:hypothetical protein